MKTNLTILLTTLLAIAFQSSGQALKMVKDINSGSNGSSISSPVFFQNQLFFSAYSDIGNKGEELWKSDGTAAGTLIAKDIDPGSGYSSPSGLIVMNGNLFFAANDGGSNHDEELFISDGTAAGTLLVKDINTSGSSYPESLTDVNGTLFFVADDGTNKYQLWKSDGTAAGTVMVKKITQANNLFTPNRPTQLTAVGNLLYFVVNTTANGLELWKTDGTDAGTVMVKDIVPGSGSSDPSPLINVNGTLFFNCDGGTANGGVELWKSDGTAAGTVLVKDINPGTGNSFPENFTVLNGELYFAADDGTNGVELWKSDGTSAGTILVNDINPGATGSSPINLTTIGGKIYFAATTDATGSELYVSDGTGTILIADIVPGTTSSVPRSITNVNGMIFFIASGSIWKIDGTGLAVNQLSVQEAGFNTPLSITAVNSSLFVVGAATNYGSELFFTESCTTPPTPGIAGPNNIVEVCYGTSAVLISQPGQGKISWYTDQIGGTYVGSGATFTTGPLTQSGYFYAQDSLCFPSGRNAVMVTVLPQLHASIANQTNVLCNAASTGSATVSANGGTGSLNYLWSPSGGAFSAATGLAAGTYSCTIKDTKNCSIVQEVVITQPDAIVPSISAQTNVLCNGATTGSATLSVSGGTPVYTYSWSPGGETTAAITNKAAGSYTCTIKDSKLCTKTQMVNITQPGAITTSITAKTNPACNGDVTGSATVAASGGITPYTYLWDHSGGSTPSIANKPAGTYNCTIKDANSCEKVQQVIITEPDGMVPSISAQTNPTCYGDVNGSATVSVTGGTPAYGYSWSPGGETSATISGKPDGTYTCTIKDSKQCTKTQVVTLIQPPNINTTMTRYVSGTTSTIFVAETGATYQWFNCDNNQPFANATQQSYLTTATSGHIKVQVTKYGCTVESPCEDLVTVGLKELSGSTLKMYPNPTNGEFTIELPFNASVEITNMTGQIIYTNTLTNGATLLNLNPMAKGVYNIKAVTTEGVNYIERLVID